MQAGRVLTIHSHEGTLEEAGFTAGLNEAIDEIAEKWAQETGVPFTFMVVRHGVIAHHNAYGSIRGKPIDTHAAFDIASISKMLTGVLLAQFIEQGLIELDAPIGEYLPDLPIEGDKVMIGDKITIVITGEAVLAQ